MELVAHLVIIVLLGVLVWRSPQVVVVAPPARVDPPAPVVVPVTLVGHLVLVDADERVEHARVPMPAKRPRTVKFDRRTYEQARQIGDDWIYRESA